MKLMRQIRIAQKIFAAKVFQKYSPLTVSWSITRRCRQTCSYCGVVIPKKELDTQEVFTIIDQFSYFGTERISFTGGEPLLREDLGDIVDYAKSKGIASVVNTNGDLLTDVLPKLSNVERLTMSFDGPDTVHQEITRGNSHHLDVIKLCQERRIPLVLTTVLSKANFYHLDYVLNVAKTYDVKVLFQPGQLTVLGADRKNPLALTKEEYQRQIHRVIEEKGSGNRQIYNSLSGLTHLAQWPDSAAIPCWAAKLHCRIDTDGYVFPCGHTTPVYKERSIYYKDLHDYNDLYNLVPLGCRHCWCGSMVEYNLTLAFKLDAFWNMAQAEARFLR